MDSFINAKLINYRKLNVLIYSNTKRLEPFVFYLYKDGKEFEKLTISKKTTLNEMQVFELVMTENIEFGHEYAIFTNDFALAPVDISLAPRFENFDEIYSYDGDDLGANYTKEATEFVLWAPIASRVSLKIEDGENFKIFLMIREEKGVYRLKLHGDFANKKYHYIVTNSGVTRESNDPYGKGVSLNSEYSTVVDFSILDDVKNVQPKLKIENYVDSIIYETNVRDFTESKSSNIKNKGKYLGFVEENAKTKQGNPCGIDYLKFLGITHVQLQPVLDFAGVDDVNCAKSYNWGYDVTSFFALEGSYSNNPENPTSRILEFKKMVEKLHENNIRVVLDVVYNHIFDYQNSSLEACVPNYYFRRTKNGAIANASGCGNDIASERKMVSKLIKDSMIYLLKTFNIDGFRLDLMGLLDINTINSTLKELKFIKPDLIFYGEGWDMGYELPSDKKGMIKNHAKMPQVAFFNNFYRDIMVGSIYANSLNVKGFANGNPDYKYGLDFVIHGSCLKKSYEPMFDDANQSINYFECHDNFTYFDKLLVSNENEDEEILLKRVKFANKLLVLSFGIPFIHSGQEIGQSKMGNGNTYNIPKINTFDLDLLDERFEMVSYLKNAIALRKRINWYKLYKPKDIDAAVDVDFWNNKIFCLKTKDKKYCEPFEELMLLANNECENKNFDFDSYYAIIQGVELPQEIIVKNNFSPGCSVGVYSRKDGK